MVETLDNLSSAAPLEEPRTRVKVYTPITPNGRRINKLFERYLEDRDNLPALLDAVASIARTRDPERREELIQRTHIKLVNLLPTFEDQTGHSFYYFAKTIMNMVGLTMRNERRRAATVFASPSFDKEDDQADDDVPGKGRHYHAEPEGRELKVLFLSEELSREEVFLMGRLHSGYTFREIAEEMGVSVSTVERKMKKLAENARNIVLR